jgi:hypothetical protein
MELVLSFFNKLLLSYEKFADIKAVVRRRTSKKNKQYKSQTKQRAKGQ